jgi:FlaA1/EpsC-like NDP-sugar epimerase
VRNIKLTLNPKQSFLGATFFGLKNRYVKLDLMITSALQNIFRKALKIAPPFHLRHWKWFRLAIFVTLDAATIAAAWWLAFFLRFDDLRFGGHRINYVNMIPYVVVCSIAMNFIAGIYRQVWRYATLHSALIILRASALGAMGSLFVAYMLEERVPRSIFVIYTMVVALLTALFRFFWRGWADLQLAAQTSDRDRCVIYGAGSGGDLLARHIAANPKFPYRLAGFLDDDPNKKNRLIHGHKILGSGKDLKKVCEKYEVKTVILAMPSASGTLIRGVFAQCSESGVKALTMPDMADALGSDAFTPRNIDLKDLLRRAPKATDKESIKRQFGGKVVLVTGAGGSIGSELCRQLMKFQVGKLVILDASELSLYQIDTELRDMGVKGIEIIPVLGSVTDETLINHVFSSLAPDVVFHAAAYKHVPLVEANPVQGILNNVLGTKVVAEASLAHGVERFLLISSDKAVRPTSVMGATKRCAELLIQIYHERARKNFQFSAVRFGNVLGSSGSVVPRFISQIQKGGPITVTHPEVTRYFMLDSEAVGLVLQAAAMASGGEIFVLDMGEPVKIAEMAQHLVQLSGKKIEIVYTSLRPGEKLYEELILEGIEEGTLHDNIFVNRNAGKLFAPNLLESINRVIQLAQKGDAEASITLLNELATGAQTKGSVAAKTRSGTETVHIS